ncbi:MAG: oligosaccharide flippase family protein [Solirubrobacteraceae bacterium]
MTDGPRSADVGAVGDLGAGEDLRAAEGMRAAGNMHAGGDMHAAEGIRAVGDMHAGGDMRAAGDARAAEDLRAAAMHGVRWSSIARPTAEFLLLGSMVVLARLIPPAEFGRYAVALIGQELAYVITAEGVGSALVQRKLLRREHLQAGMALGLLTGLVLAGLMLVVASLAIDPIFGSRTAQFVRLVSPLCLIAAAGTVSMALLRRRMAFRRLSEIEVASTLVRVVTCIALALAGLGGAALIYGMLASTLAMTAIAWASAPPPLPRLHLKAARELLDYGFSASMAAASWVGFRNSDYAIVGARLGVVPAGLYFRAYTLAVDYQKKVSMVMGQVGFPLLARTRGAAELAEMRRQMVRLLTIALFPLLVLLAIGAPVLVPFLFGPKWAAAAEPTQILAVGGAATLVIDAVGTVLMANGRTRALLGYGLSHWIVYAGSVFVVVPLGIDAVAVDAAVVHTLFLVFAYRLMLRDSPERPLRCLWSDICPATVACVGLVAVTLPASVALTGAHLPPFLWLAAVGLIAVPSYLLTLRLCFPATWRGLRVVLEHFVPEHPRLRWMQRRLTAAGVRSAA